jgi:hypothetical protein
MTVRPGDENAGRARGRGYLGASHADREYVIDTLKAAFVHGYVTKDELDARAGQTFASRTYADLARVTADLPAGLAAARPPSRPARTRHRTPADAKLGTRDRTVVATAILAGVAWTVAFAAASPPAAFLAIVSGLVSLFLGAAELIAQRDQRPRGQLPPRRAMNAGARGA